MINGMAETDCPQGCRAGPRCNSQGAGEKEGRNCLGSGPFGELIRRDALLVLAPDLTKLRTRTGTWGLRRPQFSPRPRFGRRNCFYDLRPGSRVRGTIGPRRRSKTTASRKIPTPPLSGSTGRRRTGSVESTLRHLPRLLQIRGVIEQTPRFRCAADEKKICRPAWPPCRPWAGTRT